jgi:hypothetical protein
MRAELHLGRRSNGMRNCPAYNDSHDIRGDKARHDRHLISHVRARRRRTSTG